MSIMNQAGKPVTGQAFIGREKELKLLVEYLKMGQSVAIIAPRRFGKTSLVLEVLQQIKGKEFYTAFIDVFTNPTLELLATSLTEEVLRNHKLHNQFKTAKNSASALIKNIKLKAVLDDFQFIIGFAENTKDEWELISESIEFVDAFSKKHKKQMICAYDEFGDIGKYPNGKELVKLFRSKIQQHQNSTYIFSGSYESVMNQMFVDSKSPFHRMTRIIKIGYIEQSILVKSLEERFDRIKIKVSNLFVKNIVSLTKGHPYYSQLAFQQVVLINALEGTPPSEIELLHRLLMVEKDYLEKVWEDLSRNKEYIYTLLSLTEGSKNIYSKLKPTKINVARALKKLEGMGIIFYEEDIGYYIADPLFHQWIIQRI